MFRHPMFDRRDAKRVRLELSRASGRAEIMDAPGCGPIASVSVIGDDLAVIRAGRADRRDTFVAADLGLWLRIAHHIDFPDYDEGRSLGLADRMPAAEGGASWGAGAALADHVALCRRRPHFANARSLRNALRRARPRQAPRHSDEAKGPLDAAALSTLEEGDISVSRVFRGGFAPRIAPPPRPCTTTTEPRHDLRPFHQDRPVDPFRRFR
jgi:hypothetical protein